MGCRTSIDAIGILSKNDRFDWRKKPNCRKKNGDLRDQRKIHPLPEIPPPSALNCYNNKNCVV
jgi:hypothetical protein